MVIAQLGVKTDTSGPRDQADRAAIFGLWPTCPHTRNEWAAGVTATSAAYSRPRTDGLPVGRRCAGLQAGGEGAELSARLTAGKKTPERAWLSEVSSVVLQLPWPT